MDAKEKESRVGGTDFGRMGCFGGWVEWKCGLMGMLLAGANLSKKPE